MATNGNGNREMMMSSDELVNLRTFVRALFEKSEWPEGGDIDGYDFQDLAVEHGILTPETVTAPCGDNCWCLDYHGADDLAAGATCYKKPKWMIDETEKKS